MAVVTAFAETSLVLDTDVFSHWRNSQPYAVTAISDYISRLKRPPSLTSITIFEAIRGIELALANRKTSEADTQIYRSRTERLSEQSTVLAFDHNAASIAAHICARLGDNLFKKHWRDIFIAATAIAHNHGVATGNRRDFEIVGNALSARHQPLQLAIWKP